MSKLIDWENADLKKIIPLRWPLELEQYFTIYPKNIIVIAGEKNAGKTAMCLNLAYLNSNKFQVNYFSSEMGEQELAVRLRLFPDITPFRKVAFWELDGNLADQVKPNGVNIFDFLELEDEFWKVARKIREVFNRLDRGVAIIAIQKDEEKKWGRGKAFSSEKSRVYLTLTANMVKLEMVKNWKGDKNPNGKALFFQLENQAVMIPKNCPQREPQSRLVLEKLVVSTRH